MSWEENKLSSLCFKITDGTHDSPKSVSNGFPYIKGTQVKNGLIDFDNCEYLNEKDHLKVISRSKPEKGDILFANIGANIGECAYVNVDFEFSIKNVALFKPDTEYLNGKFLYYLLSSDLTQRDIKNRKSGSAQPFLSLKLLRNYKIQYPPLETQKRIADILSSYDDLIENNLKRIKLLEQAAQNIYKEWFVNMRFPGHENTPINPETGLPEGWKKTSVTHYFDFIRGIEVGSKNYLKKQSANTIPFIRVGSLGSRDTDIFTNISLVKDKILSFSDVCISMDGSIGLVGYGLMGAYSTGIRKVSPKIEKYGNGFIFCLLKSQDIQDTIKAYAKGSTILHASSSIIHMTFNDSPIKISNQFNDIVEPMYNKMLNLLKQNNQLKSARDILLPRLMNQTIEV